MEKRNTVRLFQKNPALQFEWDFGKNKINPYLIPYSIKTKAWWKCSSCGFEWEASIGNRAYGSGCPMCSSSIRLITLQKSYPLK